MANGKELRRAEPIDFLKQMDETVEQSMIQNTRPRRDSRGNIDYWAEGMIPGKDILRGQEQKFFDHYQNEYAKHEALLYGNHRDDRVLIYRFLDIMEDDIEVPYKDKVYANKLIELDNKLQDRLKTVQDKIRFDSKSRVPTQMDKYPKNLLTKEEAKEITSLKRKIERTELYRDMELDQRRVNNNKQRRKYDENVPEYTSRYGFKADPYPNIRNKKDPTEYSGQAPHWSDVEPKYRKGYYSQLQKPKVGMMERIMYKLRGGDEALIK